MTGSTLGPDFEAIIARARQRAEDLGALRTERERKPFVSPLSPEECEIVAAWLRDGGFDAAHRRNHRARPRPGDRVAPQLCEVGPASVCHCVVLDLPRPGEWSIAAMAIAASSASSASTASR